jgi:hypothetical protein
MKAENFCCYVLLFIFYVIKFCWTIKCYISIIAESTTGMPHLRKLCKGLQDVSPTVCVTEITLLNQDPWISTYHGLSLSATFSWCVVVRSESYELLNSSPLTDLQKKIIYSCYVQQKCDLCIKLSKWVPYRVWVSQYC